MNAITVYLPDRQPAHFEAAKIDVVLGDLWLLDRNKEPVAVYTKGQWNGAAVNGTELFSQTEVDESIGAVLGGLRTQLTHLPHRTAGDVDAIPLEDALRLIDERLETLDL